jgi:iron(III) transport system permease protein
MSSTSAIAARRTEGPEPARTTRRLRLGGMPVALLAAAVLVALVVILPVGVTIVQGFQGGISAAVKAIDASSPRTLLLHSFLVALVAAPLAGVLGVTAAWFIERTRLPGRRLWMLLAVVPLTMPLFVTSYAWVTLGTLLQGFLGAAGIIAFSYYPIVFLLCAGSLRGMDPALEETARSLGLNARQMFFRVVLPQLRPALLGGMLLVVLEIILCVLLLFAESRLRGGANYTRVSQGVRRPLTRYRLGRATIPVLLWFVAGAVISVGIPVGTLIYWFTQTSEAGLADASANVRYLWPATVTSVGLGVGGALLALLYALPVALLVVRFRGRVSTVLERATYLTFALPDLVAAIALAYAASHYAPRLYGSLALLVLAESVLFVPFAIVAMRATLGQIEPALEDSARSLGVGPLRAFARVTMPLARPGMAAAGVLVFAFILGDLGTAQVLLPPNLYTLGTEFQANASTVAFAAAAPFAAVLVALAMLAAYVLMSRFGEVRALGDG